MNCSAESIDSKADLISFALELSNSRSELMNCGLESLDSEVEFTIFAAN